MKKENDKDNSTVGSIFSTKGILIAILLLIAYWVFFDDNSSSKKSISYNPQQSVLGISDSLSQSAINRLGVDLTEHLDPKIVPALVEQAMKETAESGVKEAEFIQVLVTKVSNKIKEISTIDLNGDEFADPVLVIPVNVGEGAEHLQLSIRVPDPSEVTKYPSGTDQAAWRDIVDNKSIEIMTVSAIKEDNQNMLIQTSTNSEVYNHSAYPPYYHHRSSFSGMLMTGLMLNYMFMPRYYGGFGGYGGYAPQRTTVIRQTRPASTSSVSKATPSRTAGKSASGRTIASNSFKKTSPTALNKIKGTQFKARNKAVSRAGGFGSSRSSSVARSSQRSSTRTFRKPARRSFGSFFGRSSRSSFGGFSRRSFGGFRRRR